MKYILIWIFKFYKKFISPLFPARCIYIPTCSYYGIEAVSKHGFFKGLALTTWRLLRCNPFSRGGYDPVPLNFKGDVKWVL